MCGCSPSSASRSGSGSDGGGPAPPALRRILGGAVALTRDPLEPLHGQPLQPRRRRRPRCDRMDRVHRSASRPRVQPSTWRLGGRRRGSSRGERARCARCQQLLLAALDLEHHQPTPHEHRPRPGDHVADDPRDQCAQTRGGERVRGQRHVAAEHEAGQPTPSLGPRDGARGARVGGDARAVPVGLPAVAGLGALALLALLALLGLLGLLGLARLLASLARGSRLAPFFASAFARARPPRARRAPPEPPSRALWRCRAAITPIRFQAALAFGALALEDEADQAAAVELGDRLERRPRGAPARRRARPCPCR